MSPAIFSGLRTVCGRALAGLLFVLLPVSALAATISGRVTDSTGAALPDARVVLRGVATGQETVVGSDSQGQYRVEAPTAGAYLVIVTRAGF